MKRGLIVVFVLALSGAAGCSTSTNPPDQLANEPYPTYDPDAYLSSIAQPPATTAPTTVATKAPVKQQPLVAAPKPKPTTAKPKPPAPATDPDYGTCKEAKANGAGPYYEGEDPEYYWYTDRDKDGVVCE